MGRSSWNRVRPLVSFVLALAVALGLTAGIAGDGAAAGLSGLVYRHAAPRSADRALPLVPGAFGADSGVITNRFTPFAVGDRLTYQSYGVPGGDITGTMLAEAVEAVDGVQCLKVTLDATNGWKAATWVAQDAGGNVWLLKEWDAESGFTTLNKAGALLWMAANPAVGTKLPGWEQDTDCTVMETGVTVASLRTGLGPFTEVVKLREDWGPGDVDYEYFAPGTGLIWSQWDDDGQPNGLELRSAQRAGGGAAAAGADAGGGGGGGCFLRRLEPAGR